MVRLRLSALAWLPSLLTVLACSVGADSPTPAETQGSADAEVTAQAREILQRVSRSYRELTAYHLEGILRVDLLTGGREQRIEAPFVLAATGTKRVRDELRDPQAGMLMVSDGEQTWNYVAALGQYRTQPAKAPSDSGGVAGGVFSSRLLTSYRSLADDVVSARVVREESIDVGGIQRPAWVLEARFNYGGPKDPPRQLWVDRERNVILRQRGSTTLQSPEGSVQQTETLEYTMVKLNEPVPDSLFVFRAPAGARSVDMFSEGGQPGPLSGSKAIDFTLADLAGKKHTLSQQRGKVVMLDFWASWCGPCRMQMPRVEKLHHEYKSRGLVVYAINLRESPSVARRYLEKNKYTTTALLDPTGSVSDQYRVTGIPSLVVIDKEGMIAAHFVGVRSEDDLREAILKAGLK
jgi:thiol-disulfide isomerase/thioredoxin